MTSPHELSWDQARKIAGSICRRLPDQRIPLEKSIDRILAENVYALCDLPTYTTSAMDGFALCGAGPWKIIGDIKAGEPSNLSIISGEAMRIATGAVMPEGADTVVEWESAKIDGGTVIATTRIGSHIRPAGAECQIGELLFTAGTIITPGMMGFLSAAGHDEVVVIIKPRIALLLLGDELLHSGLPHGGRVRDALGPQLPAWLNRLGAEVVIQEFVVDELEEVVASIKRVSTLCDLIITTGGTADGPRDHVHAALEKLGAILVVDRVRSRPGHPQLLAQIPMKTTPALPLLGLPGNPQSAVVGLMTMGLPVIFSLLGRVLHELELVITTCELSAPENFNRLILGNLIAGEFVMGEHLGSAMLRGLANSQGFAVAQSGITPIGSKVGWLPLP